MSLDTLKKFRSARGAATQRWSPRGVLRLKRGSCGRRFSRWRWRRPGFPVRLALEADTRPGTTSFGGRDASQDDKRWRRRRFLGRLAPEASIKYAMWNKKPIIVDSKNSKTTLGWAPRPTPIGVDLGPIGVLDALQKFKGLRLCRLPGLQNQPNCAQGPQAQGSMGPQGPRVLPTTTLHF